MPNFFYFFHFTEIFFADLLIFYIFYAVRYDGSRLFSQPILAKTTTSFAIFSFSILLFSFGSLAANLSFSFFFCPVKLSLFSLSFKSLVLFSGNFLLLVSKDYLRFRGVFRYEYDFFFVFSVFGLLLLSSANDFLSAYLAIEMQGLCFYLLATFQRDSEFSTEAGLKYFVLGAFSSGLLLFGFFLLYLVFGAVSFEALSKLSFSSNFIALWGFFFVAAAFFFKVGAAPFHMWLCDVYEGCLTTVSAFFASIPKLVLFSVLIKLYIFVFSGYQEVSTFFLLFSGFLSVFLAAFGGLYQKRLKRLLAYSAISHTGFILLGTSIASVGSIMSCVIYLVLYVFMSLASFSILLLVGVNNKIPKYLVNWAALASRNSVLAITFSLLLFSAAGVPPLSGFYSKLCILLSLLACDFLLATIFVVLLTSVTCFYYIRLIKLLFFANFGPNNFWVSRRSRTIELLLAFAATFVILFFLRPNFLNVFAVVISVSLLPCVF